MTKLEKAKEIVNTYFIVAGHGIFNTRNTVGDEMETVYAGEGLIIDICFFYEYFEVFGLSIGEFEELEKYYESLRNKKRGQKMTKEEKVETFIEKVFAPVEDKPGYVWLSRRRFQIISIETLRKALKQYYKTESEE